jgi:hypothetical protein
LCEGLRSVPEVEVGEEEVEKVALDLGLPLEDLLAEEVDLQGQSHYFRAAGMGGAVLDSRGDVVVDDGELLGYFIHLINC